MSASLVGSEMCIRDRVGVRGCTGRRQRSGGAQCSATNVPSALRQDNTDKSDKGCLKLHYALVFAVLGSSGQFCKR
eukprot:13189056-Alexandrium_andersonii.AAC.1